MPALGEGVTIREIPCDPPPSPPSAPLPLPAAPRPASQRSPRLVAVLSAEESAVQPGAAWVLGKIGEAAHVNVILRAAAERANGSRAEEFFEAAYGLDAVHTKEWLFSFVTLMGRPVFRDKA